MAKGASGLACGAAADAAAIKEYYDRGANSYDRDLAAWDYQAPGRIARLCEEHGLMKGSLICDVGCGTGMSGDALAAKGFRNIHGGDLSPASIEFLKEHRKNVYEEACVFDMNATPYSFTGGTYDAVTCVGTLTFFGGCDALHKIFMEFVRLLRPGGLALFTMREDLMPSSEMRQALARLSEAKEWVAVYESEPESYLPKHPLELQRSYRIRSFIFQKPGMVEMKVSTKNSVGFYARAASSFLRGVEAREAIDDKDAVEAKAPVERLKISGLGDAITAAVAAAAQAEADGIGEITLLETQYREMPGGRGCAQISILVKRT